MARENKVVTIQQNAAGTNRDAGKVFFLKEKPADVIEGWAIRTIQLFARCGVDMPPDIFSHGSIAFMALGIGSLLTGAGKIPYHEIKPLLDELNTCIISFRAPGAAHKINDLEMIKGQIEEVSTWFTLREAIIDLHMGFSPREYLLNFLKPLKQIAAALKQNMTTLSDHTVDQLQRASLVEKQP